MRLCGEGGCLSTPPPPGLPYWQHCVSETEQQVLRWTQQADLFPVVGTAAKAYAAAPSEITTAIAVMSLRPFFMSYLQMFFKEVDASSLTI